MRKTSEGNSESRLKKPLWTRRKWGIAFTTTFLLGAAVYFWPTQVKVESSANKRNVSIALETSKLPNFGSSSANPIAPAKPTVGSSPIPLKPSNLEKQTRQIPEIKLPLVNIFAELKDLAQHGNRAAACRLAYELQRCEIFARNKRKLGDIQAYMAADNKADNKAISPRQALVKQETEDAIYKEAPICEKFGGSSGDISSNYLLLAAQLGQTESMVAYAFRGSDGLYEQPPDPAELAVYQANAPALLSAALQAGLPQAYMFAGVVSAKNHFGVQLLPKDPVMAIAYELAIAKVATPDIRKQIETQGFDYIVQKFGLKPQDLARANEIASNLALNIKVTDPQRLRLGASLFPPDDGKHCQP